MARKNKGDKLNIVKPPEIPSTINSSELKIKQPNTGKFVAHKGLLDYSKVAFGDKQDNHKAPLVVPDGFATQIPYNSAINSTIIQNTSAIPVTTFYTAMIGDPIVYQCMLYMITTIIARIGDYNNKDKKLEKLIRDTIKRIGKNKLYQALLTSLWAGFAAIKLNWKYIDGYTTIESITVLPPDSVMLAVTPEGELDPKFGVMQYYYNLNSEWNQNGKAFSNYGNFPFAAFSATMSPQRQVSFNPMFLSALPEKWRILHTFNPTGLAGNFWGNSMIASIFSSLVDKYNTKLKLQVGITFKAAPLVFMETDTQTQVQTSGGTTISKAEDMQQVMADASSTGYAISEGMNAVKITTIDNTMDVDKIINAIEHFNNEIRSGLCTPNLTGNSGSYANAMANNQSNDEIINNITLQTIDTLESKFVKYILDEAIDIDGGEKIEDYGHFELLDNSLEDKAIWIKILEGCKNIGILRPNEIDDYNFIRKRIGMTEVDTLDDDVVHQMMSLMMTKQQGTNIGKTKETIKKPYANGMEKKKKNDYAS